MKKFTSVIGAVMLGMGLAGAAMAATGVEGTVWKATLGDGQQTADTLVFVDGKFVSTKCVPYGYKMSSFSTDGATWHAEQKSGSDKIVWTGQVQDKQMTGQFVRTSANGEKSTTKWTATKEE